ncbi:hypothetical protein DPEC_G00226510, partial [Dallia pectoralis]
EQNIICSTGDISACFGRHKLRFKLEHPGVRIPKRTKYRWNEQASEEVNVNAEYSVSDPNSKEGDIPNLSNEEDDDIHNPNSMEDNVPGPSSEEEDVTDPSSEEEDVHNPNSEWGDNSSAWAC